MTSELELKKKKLLAARKKLKEFQEKKSAEKSPAISTTNSDSPSVFEQNSNVISQDLRKDDPKVEISAVPASSVDEKNNE
ncbi:hypothetical protein AYI69_g11489, partial [Smittium culicis]